MQILPSEFYHIITFRRYYQLTLLEEHLAVSDHCGTTKIPWTDIVQMRIRAGWIWFTVEIKRSNSYANPALFRGLSRSDAILLQSRWEVGPRWQEINTIYERLIRDKYITHSEANEWSNEFGGLKPLVSLDFAQLGYDTQSQEIVRRVKEFLDSPSNYREIENKLYCNRKRQSFRRFFNSVESYPLTNNQEEAIVHDEDNSLVIAGAGTGKTSTVVGKIGFILKNRDAQADEILALAFARKAATELRERVLDRTGIDVDIKTFHSLGLQIIASASGIKPTVGKIATDDRLRFRVIQGFVISLLDMDQHKAPLYEYLADYLEPLKERHKFNSDGEHKGHLRKLQVRSLKGDLVRSQQERIIANWLFVNGIEYEYEASYEHPTATETHGQYQPDFYLVKSGFYLEHYGIDRDGKTAPGIDSEEYNQKIQWKRALHQSNQTTCIETFSYMFSENTIRQDLSRLMEENGVELMPLSEEELRKQVATDERILRLTRTLGSFLTLFKSNQWSLKEIRDKAGSDQRKLTFIEIFEPILKMYTDYLASQSVIDFDDMIRMATQFVRDGGFQSPYRYVIVDEFQDIARGRAMLLKALLDQVKGRRLFCVGDDWQAIFRFAGSDVGIMTSFESRFGYTRKTSLDKTFRFNSELNEASREFVQRNPRQIKKDMSCRYNLGKPAVLIRFREEDEKETDVIRRELIRVREEESEGPISVMILGRYHHSLESIRAGMKTKSDRFDVTLNTVHGSKGLEADYVFVVDMQAGLYGFPSEIESDPLIELVLASEDDLEYAEERRLFYVALTRACKQAILISPLRQSSPFVNEMCDDSFKRWIDANIDRTRIEKCPECLVACCRLIKGPHGDFWGCENYPYCKCKLPICSQCGVGPIRKRYICGSRVLEGFECVQEECDNRPALCPSCRTGMLVEREGVYGRFIGCTQWRPEGKSCTYTKQI